MAQDEAMFYSEEESTGHSSLTSENQNSGFEQQRNRGRVAEDLYVPLPESRVDREKSRPLVRLFFDVLKKLFNCSKKSKCGK